MNREEFITQLRETLRGNVSQEVINENVSFYENFILQELRKNKTEDEVLRSLGSPRMLAQTIIDTWEMDNHTGGAKERERGTYKNRGNYESRGNHESRGNYDSHRGYESHRGSSHGRVVSGTKAKMLLWGILIIFLLIMISILLIIGKIFSLVAPFLIPIIIIYFISRMFSRRR